jgi:hypothetical protein
MLAGHTYVTLASDLTDSMRALEIVRRRLKRNLLISQTKIHPGLDDDSGTQS